MAVYEDTGGYAVKYKGDNHKGGAKQGGKSGKGSYTSKYNHTKMEDGMGNATTNTVGTEHGYVCVGEAKANAHAKKIANQ
tara:strand:+ start:815 stop:1054 length:240 start_codon:yes stop_codon:yes gene_type:complete